MQSRNLPSRDDLALHLPLQSVAEDIWSRKYCLRAADGSALDASPDATLERVATALAAVEEGAAAQRHWREEFLWALRQGALPAGRILANAGAGAHKPATSTINCTVSGTIHDAMEDILGKLYEAGLTLKAGCGIGYEFSTLRPRDAFVAGAGARTSGPLSFMGIYDRMCLTISSAGGRRGAQMATFDVGHPDVLEFIRAKREDGVLRQFNLSLLVTREFMEAVQADAEWALAFPATEREFELGGLDLADPARVVWRQWPTTDGYRVDAEGRVACRVYRRLPAREVWDAVMRATYDYAEPGFILIDRYNEMNNNWFCENIRATNPCGEQGLPPYGACLLGSINLTGFVLAPLGTAARFDWDNFRRVVAVFTRMLDNVVELHGLPLSRQREEIARKRRHGMGFLGLGSALALLGLRYGSPEAVQLTEDITRELALVGWRTGLELAREKGAAPIMDEEFTVTPAMLAARPEMAADGVRPGSVLKGRVLWARYGRYMQQVASVDPDLVAALAAEGARFTHHSSIAPTGTIALSLGNNASNGIEPSFAQRYLRNVITAGRKTKEQVEVCSYELLAWRALGHGRDGEGADALPASFVTADDISPAEHIAMQAAAQRWIDSSISKTVNVPSDLPFEQFKDLYLMAYAQGLKGCTTFRFNPSAFQGVLVKQADLARTVYRFTLADGSVVEARGDEELDYEGERHTAANLYDAIKEGYYGVY
ncbi:MAG: adenosylcobalamin-dependent ribonucleoside-diphosphate reductase [Gammaproteobacteria bacterium]